MNKVFVLYEYHGIDDGLEVLAVCDSLDKAMSIADSPLHWTYSATSHEWTYTQPERDRFFVIDTVILNDLEAAE